MRIMRLFLKVTIPVMSILVVPGLLYAQAVSGTDDYARTGPYIAVGGSLAFEQFDPVLTGLVDSTSFGFNLKGGMRLSSHIATELDFQYNTFDLVLGAGDINLFSLTGNVKYYFLTDRFQPYVVTGAGGARGKVSSSRGFDSVSDFGLVARAGGGMDYYFTNHLAGYVETTYVLTTLGVDGFDTIPISFGVKYRF